MKSRTSILQVRSRPVGATISISRSCVELISVPSPSRYKDPSSVSKRRRIMFIESCRVGSGRGSATREGEGNSGTSPAATATPSVASPIEKAYGGSPAQIFHPPSRGQRADSALSIEAHKLRASLREMLERIVRDGSIATSTVKAITLSGRWPGSRAIPYVMRASPSSGSAIIRRVCDTSTTPCAPLVQHERRRQPDEGDPVPSARRTSTAAVTRW